MGLKKSCFFTAICAVLLISESCNRNRDEISPSETPYDSLVVGFLNKIAIQNYARDSESGVYFYPATTSHPANRDLADGRVLYFRYGLSVLNPTDSLLDAALVQIGSQTHSIMAAHGVNAIYPVGFEKGLQASDIHAGDTINFILPHELGFGDFELAPLIPKKSILHLAVILDSVKTGNEVRALQIQQINRFVINSNLNDTTLFPGSFVVPIAGGNGRFKLLGDTLFTPSPNEGDILSVTYHMRQLDSTTIDNRYANVPFLFAFGADPIVVILSESIKIMHEGERSLVLATSDLAYRESVCMLPDISFRGSYGSYFTYLVENKIIPDYALQITPYTPVLIETRLVGIN